MLELTTTEPASEKLSATDVSTDSNDSQVAGEEPQGGEFENIGDLIDGLDQDQLEAVLAGEPLSGREEEIGDTEKGGATDDNPEVIGDDSKQDDAGEKPYQETELTPKVEPEKTDPDEKEATKPPKRVSLAQLSEFDASQVTKIVNSIRDGYFPDATSAIAAFFPGSGLVSEEVKATAKEELKVSEPDPTAVPEAMTNIDAKIASLRQQRTEAKLAFDPAKESEVQSEIEDAMLEKQSVIMDMAKAESKAGEYLSKFNETVVDVQAKYPDIDDENSEFSRRVSDLRDLAEHRDNPILDDAAFLMTLADQAAGELGMNKKTVVAANPEPVPAKPIRPVGSVAGGNQGAGNMSSAEAVKTIQNMSMEELEAAAFE